jgi:hypothetical protein
LIHKQARYPALNKALTEVSIKFLNIATVETAVVAKFEFYVSSEMTYVDILWLYKFEDGWKIISKIYYQLPKP